jgi:hypothetical protein
MRQNIMVERVHGRGYLPYGGWEAEREKDERSRNKIPPPTQEPTPSDYPHLSPTS